MMKKEIKMPKLREEMKEGILCAWLKEEGESFRKGDPIYEIETDKVVNQVEAEEDGVMQRQIAEEGDVILCGDKIGEVCVDA
jgi:pyruvate/2-oxoglutarate dehydrogenase complex dihydrolipoamide acyltransferase (E2) component